MSSTDYAKQLSKHLTRMKQRKEEAIQKRPEVLCNVMSHKINYDAIIIQMKFGKVSLQKFAFPQSRDELYEEREDELKLSQTNFRPFTSLSFRPSLPFNTRPSTSFKFSEQIQVTGSNTYQTDNNQLDMQESESPPKQHKQMRKRSLLNLRGKKKDRPIKYQWAFLTPTIKEIPLRKHHYVSEQTMPEITRKDLYMTWKNRIIVQREDSTGPSIVAEGKSSPTDIKFSYKHANEYCNDKATGGALPLLKITPFVLTD